MHLQGMSGMEATTEQLRKQLRLCQDELQREKDEHRENQLAWDRLQGDLLGKAGEANSWEVSLTPPRLP